MYWKDLAQNLPGEVSQSALGELIRRTLGQSHPAIFAELERKGELDDYLKVKTDEAQSSIAEYKMDGLDEFEARELALDGLLPSDETDHTAEDWEIEEGMEDQLNDLFRYLDIDAQ